MAEKLLKLTIEKNPYIEAILVTDKEGIDIFTAYKSDNHPLKTNQTGILFATAFVQTNDHLIKLNQGKANAITLFYDNYLVYQEMWDSIVFTVFSTPEGNAGKIFDIAADLKGKFKDLSSMVEKIK
mgnify:CR=1 FL=1